MARANEPCGQFADRWFVADERQPRLLRVLLDVADGVLNGPDLLGVLVRDVDLEGFLERCPVTVVGLMTMPPLTDRPEDSRRWFAALRELAERHGLRELSMGTTQDYAVAAQEGATILRIGARLYT